MILKRVFRPVFTSLKKENKDKTDGLQYRMTTKERIAMKEAQKIVRVYSSKVENPFKCGQGNLDK
jgi:hypothetical protein